MAIIVVIIYTTNNIEGKITECWLVNKEGDFSHMILLVKRANFLMSSTKHCRSFMQSEIQYFCSLCY